MFHVTGKLKSGKTFRATVPTLDASAAVKTVAGHMPNGDTIVSLTLKPGAPDGFIKVTEPRTKTNGAPTPRTKRARGKRAAT